MLLLFLINKKKNLRQFLFLEGLFHFHICCNSNFMYLAATIRNNEMSGSLKRPSPVTVLIFLKILSGGKKSFCIKHIGTSLLYRFLRPMLFYPFQTALEIAKKGGTVHMICRNPKYALEAQNEIKDVSKNLNIYAHIVNMSDPKAVLIFANRFKEPLNVLINNAGCMLHKRILTQDGFEKNFATNTLGTHVLTQNLLPNLRKTNLDQKSRVIIVSSGERTSDNLSVSCS